MRCSNNKYPALHQTSSRLSVCIYTWLLLYILFLYQIECRQDKFSLDITIDTYISVSMYIRVTLFSHSLLLLYIIDITLHRITTTDGSLLLDTPQQIIICLMFCLPCSKRLRHHFSNSTFSIILTFSWFGIARLRKKVLDQGMCVTKTSLPATARRCLQRYPKLSNTIHCFPITSTKCFCIPDLIFKYDFNVD